MNKVFNNTKIGLCLVILITFFDSKYSHALYPKLFAYNQATVGVKSDGTVVGVGRISVRFPGLKFLNWENITEISAGENYLLALQSDGSVLCNTNDDYACPNTATWRDVIQIAAGKRAVGLKSDGTVVAASTWGDVDILENWGDIKQIDTNGVDNESIVGLKNDGSVVIYGGLSSLASVTSTWGDIEEVRVGESHIIGRSNDGTVVGVGSEAGNVQFWPTDVVQIAAGKNHSLGLRTNGTVIAMGTNENGQINVSTWNNVIKIDAFNNNSIGLCEDGTIVTTGELRNGAIFNSIAKIAAGRFLYAGLKSDGTVAVSNGFGVSWKDIVDIEMYTKPVDYGFVLGLKSDGTIISGGMGNFDLVNWSNIKGISSGFEGFYGIRNDGKVLWANHNFETGMLEETVWNDIIDIKSGAYNHNQDFIEFSVGLKSDGNVVWKHHGGLNTTPIPDLSHWSNMKQIDVVRGRIVGLKSDGTVLHHGLSVAETEIINTWNNIIEISVGDGFVASLKSDGRVILAGNILGGSQSSTVYSEDVASWSNIVQIEAAKGDNNSHLVALKADGHVVATGPNSIGQCSVGSWNSLSQVVFGENFAIGLKSDGTVITTGSGIDDRQFDTKLLQNIQQVATSNSHLLAVQADGTVLATGRNYENQCEVVSWTDIIQVAAGSRHSVGLKFDGTVLAVGDDTHGQLNVSWWTDIIDIAAGSFHTVGLRSDGNVIAVGDARDLSELSNWDNITQIEAHSDSTVGLKNDGTLVAVGYMLNNANSAFGNDNIKISLFDTKVASLTASGKVKIFKPNSSTETYTLMSNLNDIVIGPSSSVGSGADYIVIGLEANGSMQINPDPYYAKALVKLHDWNLLSGKYQLLRGDFNGDGVIDLSDVLIATKLLTNDRTIFLVNINADSNYDGIIGIPDILYILNELAE